MEIINGWEEVTPKLRRCAVAIGNFDGVHIGHQELISRATGTASREGRSCVVLTFYPHPLQILSPATFPGYLTTPAQKAELLAVRGVDYLLNLRFDQEMAGQEPEVFVRDYLWECLQPAIVHIGYNFTFGRGGAGNADGLTEMGKLLGYRTMILSTVKAFDKIVSSSAIRKCFLHGDVVTAALMLGHYPEVTGEVISGDRRGRLLGFPTANIALPPDLLLPAVGVYAARAILGTNVFPAVVNIGRKPTFDLAKDITVEAHILDFCADIYGQTLTLIFMERIRGEHRFTTPTDLAGQIKKDVQVCRSLMDRSAGLQALESRPQDRP